jgi:hypothetical protein
MLRFQKSHFEPSPFLLKCFVVLWVPHATSGLKVMLVLRHYAGKARRCMEIKIYAFLISLPDGGEWLAVRPGDFMYGDRTLVRIHSETEWFSERVCGEEKKVSSIKFYI